MCAVGRVNERRMEWALSTPDATDPDRPLYRVSGNTRRLIIEALEHCLVAGALEGRRYALARTCRSLKMAEALDAAGDLQIQQAAAERLQELAEGVLG